MQTKNKYIVKLYEYNGQPYYYKSPMTDTKDLNKAKRFKTKSYARTVISTMCDSFAEIIING